MWSIVASQFGPPFMFSGVAVALPAMGVDLEAGATSLGLVETIFLAGGVGFLLPLGRLADASDRRTLYKVGLLGFGLSSLLIASLSSMPIILILRFLQGITSACFSVTGAALLAEIVPIEHRGAAFGSAMSALYGGLALGPVVAGLLTDAWGWRSVFLAGGLTILAGFLQINLIMGSSWRRPARVVHIPSTLLVATAVLSLVVGSVTLRSGVIGYTALVAALLLAVTFVLLQLRITHPLVDIRALIGNRTLASALLVQMLLYVNAFTSVFLLSIYLQVSLAYPAKTSGMVLASGTVLMAVVAPIAGTLADRYRSQPIARTGVALVLLCPLLAMTLDQQSSLLLVVVVLAIQGLGFALFSSPNLTTIMASVPAAAVGMAAALGAKARGLGTVTGMLVTTMLISLSIGNEPISRYPLRYIGIMVSAYSVLAILTALALIVSLLTKSRPAR